MHSPTPETVICGDFNLPHVAWPEGEAGTGAIKDEKAMIQDLKYLSDEFFLFQQVQESTHKCGNVLDLIFCNNPAFVHSYQCSQSIFSDHHIVEVTSTYSHQARESSYRQPHASAGPGAKFDELNFTSEDVDWPGLEEDLNNQDWDRTFAGLQPTQMMHKFLEICTTTAQKFVPVCQHTKWPKSHRISRPRRILMWRMTKVNKQLAGNPSEAKRHRLLEEARSIEKKLQESYRTETSSMEHKAVSAIKTNPKYFFTYARKFSKTGTGIGPLIDATKEIISCPIRIAGKLAEQYTTVFSSPSEPLLSPEEIFRDMEARHATNLCDIQFTETDVCQAMAEISSSASAGPDRFPAILLKNCQKIRSRPL